MDGKPEDFSKSAATADAFTFLSVTAASKNEMQDDYKERILASSKSKSHQERKFRNNPVLVGWLPGLCRIVGTGVVTAYHVPIFRLYRKQTGPGPPHDWIGVVLRDFKTMCMNAMNSDLVLNECCPC
ncbi:hypothetical protein C2E23DRAFT_287434 [Lenzites betulinus]|nr:hypothetical protein C2E23DRAFT_287434 [Lenzites betulinus]